MVNQIYVLDTNLKVDKILSINGNNSFFDDLYTVELDTGTETFEFSTNINIDGGEYIAFFYKNNYKLFTVIETEQEHGEGNNIVTTCYCECATLQLINQVVRGFSGDFNCVKFMEYILQDTEWRVGYYSPSLEYKIQTIDVEKTSVIWGIIQEHMPKYNYEINPRVEIDGNKVVGYYIDLYDADEDPIGKVTNKRFEYSRNVAGIVKSKDLSEWCTAVVIEGVDVTNVSFNVTGYRKNGDVIIDENANDTYNKGKRPIYGIYEATEDSGASACEGALEDLKRRSTPHWTYEVTTAMTYTDFENVNIGDEVHVVDRTYNPPLMLSARVSKLELSFTNPEDCSLTLANYKEISSGIKTNVTIYKELLDYISKLESGILSQSQIQTLRDYMTDIGFENEEVNRVITELKKIAYNHFDEAERDKVFGSNVHLTLTEGRNYNCQDVVSYIKFIAPSVDSCSDDYEVTLRFTTRDDSPTGIYQDNNIWLYGDNSCDGMDVANGGLLPKCNCSYTITITKNDNPNYPRDFVGVVNKVRNGRYEYIGFEPTTKYTEEIVNVMQSYYDNREGNFKYDQTTPYTFTNPQANIDKWKTGNLYHCDCSTFVGMCCRGISYQDSIYKDTSRNPYLCSNKYAWSFEFPRTASEQLYYCLEQGWILDLDVANMNDWTKLQPGDLVFWKKRTGDDETNATVNARFMQVGHVAIVKALKDVDGQMIPHTFESTSMSLCFYNRLLTNNHPEKLLCFARPRK